MMNFT